MDEQVFVCDHRVFKRYLRWLPPGTWEYKEVHFKTCSMPNLDSASGWQEMGMTPVRDGLNCVRFAGESYTRVMKDRNL